MALQVAIENPSTIEYFCFILKGGEIDGMVLRDFFDVHKSRFHGEKD